ncbi:MAG: Bax inhibitor-1/YccA family protein [Candidatus Thalassarchaeum betae]|nr:Bax inhibitor-1/YccA family protein [Candidatus Thalassoarchaea betae]MEE3113465.1 Bax inhibitor-1/YccA family protein [Candidatus Thermoplasmatota archaeon]|tara:strand:+ start:59 stop:811 length:753 start_codon:yes stop_codon:yes gene_type:complete
MYRSGNPGLSDSTFDKSSYKEANWWDEESNLMSIEGVAEKTGILLLITATTAMMTAFSMPEASILILIGALGGFIVALIVIFSGSLNPILICTYAALEGLALGGITWFFEVYLGPPGIGIVAALLTFLILGAMIAIYRAGLIAWDRNTQIAVTSALVAIVLIYLISIVGVFFGFHVPYIHSAGPIGIAFSLFVVGIGALCLVADFDFIEKGVERGAPKQLEWRAAFGLMVTLIWLYLEILKLLAKIASRR